MDWQRRLARWRLADTSASSFSRASHSKPSGIVEKRRPAKYPGRETEISPARLPFSGTAEPSRRWRARPAARRAGRSPKERGRLSQPPTAPRNCRRTGRHREGCYSLSAEASAKVDSSSVSGPVVLIQQCQTCVKKLMVSVASLNCSFRSGWSVK